MKLHVLGIDLGKTVFHLVGLDSAGKVVIRKKCWVGMVPRECSTGGKQRLLGISKRGNAYLRTLFVQGARSVVRQRHKQAPGLSHWLAQLLSRTHQNVVIVALANKRPTRWCAWPRRSCVRTKAIAGQLLLCPHKIAV